MPASGNPGQRCAWARTAASITYHDDEWGVPVHDDARFFEFLTLEGAQAGLSWETVLRKRERYREVFHDFDPQKIARITPAQVEKLLMDPGIIRNRAKVESTVSNARAFLAIQSDFGSFDAYVWRFVGGAPRINDWRMSGELPAESAESIALSKDLRARGLRFVGPTIMYAFMQATGLVNDHARTCFRYRELR
ncbi:MAG: DNA-3-methyladenine glycosylase I [Candidatus Eremiobacteraeota bacterium]|nr:DNA-3-methyladenine glycosylase I [Candidatus Eremiobacteraeota bacterium]